MNKKFVYFTPLLIAIGLGCILYTAIGKDPTILETARLDDPFPKFKLASLSDESKFFDETALKGKVRLVNVWATWCPSCKAEHPYLNALSEQGISIVGLNYKDERDAALNWLAQLGDPYEFSIYDPDGTLGFELGVYGAPETYLIDENGVVKHRHVGEVNDRVWNNVFVPLLQAENKG